MMNSMGVSTKRAFGALALALAFAVAAPSAFAAEDTAAKGEGVEALRERVDAYWTARIKREKSVLDFYTKDSLDQAAEFGNVSYLEYTLEGIELLEGNEAMVAVRTKLHIPMPMGMKRSKNMDRMTSPMIREKWHLHEGVWYKRATGRSIARFKKNLRSSTRAAGAIGGSKKEEAAAEGNAEAAPGAPAPARRASGADAAEGDG